MATLASLHVKLDKLMKRAGWSQDNYGGACQIHISVL